MRLYSKLKCILFFVLFACIASAQAAHAQELFADTIYVGSVTLGGGPGFCPNVNLASLPVTVKERSRIVAYGAGVYHQNGGDLYTVALHIELQSNNNTVASSNFVPITAPYSGNVDPNNGNAFGAVSGVLQTGSNELAITNGQGTPFVADPGKYELKLILEPASSPCPYQSYIAYVSLSYFRVPHR
jgi:hypothetical protein